MNRWLLSLNVFSSALFACLGALVLAGIDLPTFARAETGPTTKIAQINAPGSTTEKKPAAAPATSPTQSTPAPAAAGEPKGPGWAVNCKSEATEKGLECRMSQTVVLKQSGQVLTNVTFRIPSDTKKPEVIVQLPLGVSLAPGATFQVDDNPAQRLNFRACDRNGCFAITPVTPEMLAVLRRGKQIKIGFQNLAEKPITVPLSLDGFGDAYEKMLKPA